MAYFETLCKVTFLAMKRKIIKEKAVKKSNLHIKKNRWLNCIMTETGQTCERKDPRYGIVATIIV